jgi:hypothetical protein
MPLLGRESRHGCASPLRTLKRRRYEVYYGFKELLHPTQRVGVRGRLRNLRVVEKLPRVGAAPATRARRGIVLLLSLVYKGLLHGLKMRAHASNLKLATGVHFQGDVDDDSIQRPRRITAVYPYEWDEAAREVMLLAAREAGIWEDELSFYPEPNAALLGALAVHGGALQAVQPGGLMSVLDIGGEWRAVLPGMCAGKGALAASL